VAVISGPTGARGSAHSHLPGHLVSGLRQPELEVNFSPDLNNFSPDLNDQNASDFDPFAPLFLLTYNAQEVPFRI
jgi:hypothetical protein